MNDWLHFIQSFYGAPTTVLGAQKYWDEVSVSALEGALTTSRVESISKLPHPKPGRARTWVNHEDVMLSEISQSQKDKSWMIPLTRGI